MQNGTATSEDTLAISDKVKFTFIGTSNSTPAFLSMRHENTCPYTVLHGMFMAILVTSKICKQHKCPSICEWKRRMVFPQMKHFYTIK